MRIGFVVLEEDVESRFVLLDEVRLEHQSLNLIVDDDEFEIGDNFYQLLRLRIVIATRLEVRADAIAKILRLADIDDLARGTLVDINAGPRR